MKSFFAVTWEDSVNLGKHKDRSAAEHYAIDKLNVHQAKPGYLILDRTELLELIYRGQQAIEELQLEGL